MSSGSHSLRLTSLEQIEKDIAQALEHAGETGKVFEYTLCLGHRGNSVMHLYLKWVMLEPS